MINDIFVGNINDYDDNFYNQVFDLLTLNQKDKINKLSPLKKKQSLLGLYLLYGVLKQNDIDFSFTDIIYNEQGKPYLKDNKVYFNISHSESKVVLVFDDQEVGIDIEKVKPRKYDLVMKKFNFLESKDIDSLEKFYSYWCAKESFMKCLGLGLSLPLNSFNCDLKNLKIYGDKDYSQYSLYGTKLMDDYIIYVTYIGKDKVFKTFEIK